MSLVPKRRSPGLGPAPLPHLNDLLCSQVFAKSEVLRIPFRTIVHENSRSLHSRKLTHITPSLFPPPCFSFVELFLADISTCLSVFYCSYLLSHPRMQVPQKQRHCLFCSLLYSELKVRASKYPINICSLDGWV